MLKKDRQSEILKRMEVLNEALQIAIEAIFEIQSEQKLISYLLNEDKLESENS